MVATASLVTQINERLKQEPEIFISATLDEYWTLLDELRDESLPLDYDIEYINGQIRARIGMASDRHETIVANIISVLRTIFYDMPDVRVMGSNKLVFVSDCELAVKPDVLVMKGESQLILRQGQEAGITNPHVLVEVHSDSTYRQDLSTKLRCYKQLESVQYIVYIDQTLHFVSVYTKQQDSRHWLNEDYNSLDMAVRLGDFSIPMQDIYHKVVIDRATNA
ncbi:Uma2 family endonuclease [Spirosoma panaciterrae]|uniref:Uma2 family endonuclease n=1 Tax=Spirosoma panaciterrae TaxID=496058 RepID=UPI0003784EA3|nr:Uma2 family endonuclease [Spirosoma panaciterrae]